MNYKIENGVMTVELSGRIDADNVQEAERELAALLAEHPGVPVMLDADTLHYISSAGLRMLLKLRKKTDGKVSVWNASQEVYEILHVTGFTEMFDVHKKMREVSIEGLPLIGAGANGWVYQYDRDTIIKVYNPLTNPPEKILREKETAKQAFIHEIPSAISFDVVRVGDKYGILYEMIDARTLGTAIREEPEKLRDYAVRMAQMLKKLNRTTFPDGVLPDARLSPGVWVDIAEKSGYYQEKTIQTLRHIIDCIPPRKTFVHGDFHPGNIMVCGDEWLLIDMGDASVGHPVIDLLATYQLMNMAAARGNGAMMYLGITKEQAKDVWDTFIRAYFETEDAKAIEEIEGILKYYAVLRSAAGVTFSKTVPEDMRKILAGQVEEFVLRQSEQLGDCPAERLPL